MSGRPSIWLIMTAAAMTGCHHDTEPPQNRADVFATEPAVHPSQQFVIAQAAAGARQDATLRAMHFDGSRLNSLGREKLDLMIRDEDVTTPLVVYLDLPDGAQAADARKSVVDFARSLGLPEGQVRFESGPNPALTSPAGQSSEQLHRLSDDKKDQPGDSKGYQPSSASNGNAPKELMNH
jgi:hypothetical protein